MKEESQIRIPATLVGHVRDLFGILSEEEWLLSMMFPAHGICSLHWKTGLMGKLSVPAYMN